MRSRIELKGQTILKRFDLVWRYFWNLCDILPCLELAVLISVRDNALCVSLFEPEGGLKFLSARRIHIDPGRSRSGR